MNNDKHLDEIEEDLKTEEESKKIRHRVSGRSVFEIERIIKEKSEKEESHNEKQ